MENLYQKTKRVLMDDRVTSSNPPSGAASTDDLGGEFGGGGGGSSNNALRTFSNSARDSTGSNNAAEGNIMQGRSQSVRASRSPMSQGVLVDVGGRVGVGG